MIALLLLAALAAHAADFDVLIRNARIVDGTGNPWYRGDIGVRNGSIAAMKNLAARTAHNTTPAAARIGAPVFIDVQTHTEGGVEQVPRGGNHPPE